MAITNEELKTAVGTEYRSLREIGEDLGVSRERVRQLLKTRGIPRPSRVFAYPICSICNLPNYRIRGKYRPTYRRHQECQSVTLICPEPCGKVFTLRRSDGRLHKERKAANNTWFCSQTCWGNWRWRTYSLPWLKDKVVQPVEIDLGMRCTRCGTDVRWDADRIGSDGEAKLTLLSGREDKTLDVVLDGWMCSTCQEVDCDACGKRSKDYDIVDSGDGTGMFACATCMGREEEN